MKYIIWSLIFYLNLWTTDYVIYKDGIHLKKIKPTKLTPFSYIYSKKFRDRKIELFYLINELFAHFVMAASIVFTLCSKQQTKNGTMIFMGVTAGLYIIIILTYRLLANLKRKKNGETEEKETTA